ncbi:MAG: tRNA (N6-threonylcarbamoyladenosine(37)-N6)-methyltransferase TrmO [Ruminococcaceae bacterium]|nr:tRNA (N6-threonylcarbamoyladenosine(37)-N6)-methyltransferase TrmO [Oscillospiraceae bacterium]
MNELTIKPIAYIRTDFSQKFGIPRQSGRVPSLRGRIVFEPEYRNKEALRGIEGFSHLWLIFDFSLSHREGWSPTVRPPRLGGNKRVGVFATRSPFRPNPLGLSCVELISVESDGENGDILIVGGADLVDMTPIYDIKPYLPYSDSKINATSGFAENEVHYLLEVVYDEEVLSAIPQEKRQALIDCLADDPRPSYQDDKERIYTMTFAGYDVSFKVEDNVLTVVGVKQI